MRPIAVVVIAVLAGCHPPAGGLPIVAPDGAPAGAPGAPVDVGTPVNVDAAAASVSADAAPDPRVADVRAAEAAAGDAVPGDRSGRDAAAPFDAALVPPTTVDAR